jgi:hypothetical protein
MGDIRERAGGGDAAYDASILVRTRPECRRWTYGVNVLGERAGKGGEQRVGARREEVEAKRAARLGRGEGGRHHGRVRSGAGKQGGVLGQDVEGAGAEGGRGGARIRRRALCSGGERRGLGNRHAGPPCFDASAPGRGWVAAVHKSVVLARPFTRCKHGPRCRPPP